MEEKFDDDSDDEYDEIDDKINDLEIDGQSDMIEKDEQMLVINKKIWISMFDHVMTKIIDHLKQLINNEAMKGCKYLGLVGGLSCSPYFQHRVKEEFGNDSEYKLKIIIPQRPILSVLKGAACFAKHPNFVQ